MTTADLLEAERPMLTSLAYRMLGTTAEAQDAVQETYLRWYRRSESERAEVANPAAWLTRTAGRVCLDVLSSARHRRETYVGPWLPEPLPVNEDDPAARAELGDEVSTALLIMLGTMTPAERVAFVLHDVFAVPFGDVAQVLDRSVAAVRQLATSARKRVEAGRARRVSRAEHDAVVRVFAAAVAGGDLAALTAVLDPEVSLTSDGGGVVSAARNPVFGVERVARFVLGVMAKRRDTYREAVSGDGLCLVSEADGHVRSVINMDVRDGVIVDIWGVLNPDKLTRWQ